MAGSDVEFFVEYWEGGGFLSCYVRNTRVWRTWQDDARLAQWEESADALGFDWIVVPF